MWIVIPTCKAYSEMYECLMRTITKKDKIITVMQLEDEESIERTNQGYTIKLKRNLYEYAGWVGVQMLADAGEVSLEDFFLMIHDTCMFGNQTFDAMDHLENLFTTEPADLLFLLKGRFHNICLARRNGITEVASAFSKYTYMTKEEALSHESRLLPPSVCTVENEKPPLHVTKTVPYSDGKERTMVYIGVLDMIKFFS
mgnify:CR=1 FL=1